MFKQQQNLGRIFSPSKMHLRPSGLGCFPFERGGSVAVVDLLLPIVCGSSVFVFVLLYIAFLSILVLQIS